MTTQTQTMYFAAAYSGTTRIPGQDGPQRSTIEQAAGDCRSLPPAWTYHVRVMDPSVTDSRTFTDDEAERAGCQL